MCHELLLVKKKWSRIYIYIYTYIMMNKVEELISKRKQKHCLRASVAQPEDIRITGKVKVAKVCSNVLNTRKRSPSFTTPSRALHPSGGEMTPRSH